MAGEGVGDGLDAILPLWITCGLRNGLDEQLGLWGFPPPVRQHPAYRQGRLMSRAFRPMPGQQRRCGNASDTAMEVVPINLSRFACVLPFDLFSAFVRAAGENGLCALASAT